MDSLRIGKLIKARSKEIEELKLDLKSFNGRKLIFQKLPRYMRRRQMSWNPKRLPKRLQVAYYIQLQKSLRKDQKSPAKKKRPRRVFRCRSKSLAATYKKRALKCGWLETHVWHAKRFHMVQRWGYKIANSSYEKSFRRCYRCSDRNCLVQDISFYNCFELIGPEEYLAAKLEELTHKDINRSITSDTYKTGFQRGSCIIYNRGKYPYEAVGPISFLWISPKKFWFWVHPAFCNEMLNMFKQTFNLDTNLQNVTKQVSLADLKLKFNMFRLTGPKSLKLLQDMLKVPSSDNSSEWFQTHVIANQKGGFEMFQKQVDNWNALKSYNLPSQLYNNQVVNLTVVNPKCVKNLQKVNCDGLPAKSDIKSEADASFVIPKYVLCKGNASSDSKPPPKKMKVVMKKEPLDLREHVNGFFYDCPNEQKIPPYKKPPCDQKLVPGEFNDVTKNAEVIPVVLIQRPGNRIRRYRNLGYGSGIDILIPKGWGRTFWYCMQLRKAAVASQRVSDMVNFEMGSMSLFAPDYTVGQQELKSIGERLRVEYFKRPPKCRLNYRKLGILMPFEVNWATLLNNWKTGTNVQGVCNSFFVLRDKVLLEKINNCLRKFKQRKMESVTIPEANNCLVPIRLTFKNSKGCVSRLSPICLPCKEDVSDNLSIAEPNHKDPNEDKRKIAKKEHKRLLKKYRRGRIKAIKMKNTIPDDNEAEIAKYKMENESLWLSDVTKVTDIRHSCQRQVIGFVEYGDFSMLFGYGAAIGYVTANGLLTLLKNEKVLANGMALVRDKNSLRYRPCDIETVPLDIIV